MNSPALGHAGMPGRAALEKYYRLHARIYDATRWSFLFGRAGLLREAAKVTQPARILEVGCGTGKNLVQLARRFPAAEITGLDLSEPMLERARGKLAPFRHRVQLRHQAYGGASGDGPTYDFILFSYALTMFNPGFEAALANAHHDLAPGGHLAVVDFHDTPLPWFARWMGVNHVRMDGQLRPLLRAQFTPCVDRLHRAYGGVWRYLEFIGRKPVADESV